MSHYKTTGLLNTCPWCKAYFGPDVGRWKKCIQGSGLVSVCASCTHLVVMGRAAGYPPGFMIIAKPSYKYLHDSNYTNPDNQKFLKEMHELQEQVQREKGWWG